MTLRKSCAFLLALGVVLAGRSATAAQRRVAVVPFDGDAGARAQSEVHKALNRRFVLIAPRRVAKGINQVGGLRESARATYAALARKVRADAIVSGSIVHDTKWRLRMAVRDGGTGALVVSTVWTHGHLKDVSRTISGEAKSWLVAQLASTESAEMPAAAPPPSPPPAPREPLASADADEEKNAPGPAPDADPDPPPRSAAARRPAVAADEELSAEAPVKKRLETRTPLFELAVGPRVFSRSFTYTDNLAGLPGYTIVGAPGTQVDLEIYPLARVDTGIRNVGFAGSYELSRNARTQASTGAMSYETKISAYRAGIRYSIPLSRLLFNLGVDYGQHRFALVGGPDQAPNVGYKFVRPSAAFRADVVSALAVGLTVGYSNVTAVQGLGDADRFRRLTAVGVDAQAMVGYFFNTGIELKLVGDVRYYAHSMNVQLGDPYPVGGAIDAHVGASLLLGYLLR